MVYNRATPRIDVFAVGAQAFHFDAGGAAGTSRCYGNMLISGTTTSTGTLAATNAATVGTTLDVTGLITASVGLSATTGDITTVAGDLVSASDVVLSGLLYFDGPGGNDTMQYAAGLLRTSIAGAAIGDWHSGGIDLASGKALSINSTRLTLAEAALTYNPAAAGLFTWTLTDALLLQSQGNATTRAVLDIFRNSSTGSRVMLHVRDSTTDALRVTSNAGVPQIGFYTATPVSRPAAYTQTAYATAARVVNALTSANLAINPATNIAPWGYSSQANAEAIQTELNALRADLENVKQVLNAQIDDRQADGLAQ
jgi:hypothetical protein